MKLIKDYIRQRRCENPDEVEHLDEQWKFCGIFPNGLVESDRGKRQYEEEHKTVKFYDFQRRPSPRIKTTHFRIPRVRN